MLTPVLCLLPIVAAEPLLVPPPSPLPSGVFPAPSTTLPENAVILVANAERVLITHDDERVEDLLVGAARLRVGGDAVGTVTPALTEGETITLEVVCDGCSAREPLSWVVGPVDDTSPVFATDVTISATDFGGTWSVSPRQQRFAEDEQVLLHFVGVGVDEGIDEYLWQNDEDFWSNILVSGVEREACFDVTAVDAAGNTSDVQRACVDLVGSGGVLRAFGCASTGSANTALVALMGLVLRRRRRRTGE